MRLHLRLRPVNGQCSISLSYSYYLSTAIYKWIETSSPSYILPDDPLLSDLLRANILNKYISLYGHEPEDTRFVCTLDQDYVQRKNVEGKRITQLITIKEGRTEETRVRGFMCPFTLEGNPDLIRLAYESGLGEKNAMGFGMMDVVQV